MEQHLVFDLFHGNGWESHYATIIVQENLSQVYKIGSLHITLHYALRGKENMNRRVEDLLEDGFQLLTKEEAQNSRTRPERLLIIVPPGENFTGVKEIEVINDLKEFGDDAQMMFETIPFDKLAQYLVKKQSIFGRGGKKDHRNSRSLSAGYSQQRQTNNLMCPGLNTPEFTNSTDKLPPVENGRTVTQSLLTWGCTLMGLSDLISQKTQSQRAFTDQSRAAMFMKPVAEKHKIPLANLRFEGVTAGNTGTNTLWIEESLDAHFDIGNDPRNKHGQNLVICANKIVQVEYRPGKFLKTRTAVIIYNKKCVGDNHEKYSRYQPIALKYEQWIEQCRPVLNVNPYTIRMLGLSEKSSPMHMIRPQWTKEFYYSPFIDKILQVGKISNWDGILMLEVAYAIVFTPNAKTFCHGVDLALKCEAEENFIFRYINSLVREYGSVSGGEGRRRMCSHGLKVSRYRLAKSLANLPRLLQIVNKTGAKTSNIIKEFTKPPEQGGMFLVGKLSCQEFLHVLTMVSKAIVSNKFITNECHMRNVAIASSTKTSNRLLSHRISSDSDRIKLMAFLRKRLSISYSPHGAIDDEAIENGLCESLRYHAGQHVYEFVGNVVYTKKDDSIVAYNLSGGEIDLTKEFGKCKTSFPPAKAHSGVMWWKQGELAKYKKLGLLDGDILLTSKSAPDA